MMTMTVGDDGDGFYEYKLVVWPTSLLSSLYCY